ncbi:MAG: ABC transporter substrate-binding protein [Actinomycetes bacterium]
MRRRVLIAVAATLCAAAALAWGLYAGGQNASGAGRPEKATLILLWEPEALFAGYYMAVEKGFYRDHGLDVVILPGGPAIDPIDSLTSGRADFALSFLSGAIGAAAEGVPLVNVGQVVNRSSMMIVGRGSVIRNRDDLDGRRVSLWGKSFRSAYLGFFDTAGLEPRIVPQYYSVNLFLQGGVAACAAMEYNEYHTILQAGIDPDELTTFFMRDAGFGFPEDGIYTLAATARERPEVCRELAAATLEGWEYCRGHRDEAVGVVMERAAAAHVPTNRVHQRWMLDHVLAAVFPGEHDDWQAGVLSPVDYERTRAIMIGEGLIAGAPPYKAFVAPGARSAP